MKLITMMTAFLLALCMAACFGDDPLADTEKPVQPGLGEENAGEAENGNEENNQTDTPMNSQLTITVNGAVYQATLADTPAARAFAALLPLTLDMHDLNGNEKYSYLDSSLPTETCRPGTIRPGDLMLYGSSCVVVFYETFATGYSYTRLGQIDHPDGLATALGKGDATVRFELTEEADE